jgi:hypothetical protein
MSKVIPQLLATFDFELENPEKPWETNTSWFVKQKFGCFVKRRQLNSKGEDKEVQSQLVSVHII